MKKFFYHMALVLTACAGFASCADNFDEDERYVYPAQAPAYGAWTYSNYADDDYSYTLNITENAAGDSIMTVTMFDAEGGTFTSSGRVTEYDAVSGTLVAEGYTQLGYVSEGAVVPAIIYASYNNARNKLSVSISMLYNGRFYDANTLLGAGDFTGMQTKYPASVGGVWVSADGSVQMQLAEYDETANAYIGMIALDGQMDYCTWSYDAATGVAVIKIMGEDTTYKAAFNEKSQFVFDKNGAEVVLDLSIE